MLEIYMTKWCWFSPSHTSMKLSQIHLHIFWYISFQQIISLNRHFLNKRNACSSKWWNYYCVWATLFDIYLFSKLKSCYIFSNLCGTMEVELKWNIWILNAKRDNKSFAGQTFDFIQDVEDSVFETTNLYLEISRFVIWTGRCRSAIEVHNCCMQKLALQFFFPL